MKRLVLRAILKEAREWAFQIWLERAFQMRGTAAAKALPPAGLMLCPAGLE